MASYLLAADENDNDMKADNWDDGMYDCPQVHEAMAKKLPVA
jgi:hypothetical protein